MKIIFWGEEHGCGTTSHMLAAAGMLKALCPGADIAIGASGGRRAAFHFFDGGTAFSVRRQHMLRTADLVVVNLKATQDCAEHFFLEHRCIAENMLVLMGGRREEAAIWRGRLACIYRVPMGCAEWISYNDEFYQAIQREDTAAFIKCEYERPGSFRNEQFIGELLRVALFILRRAEALPEFGMNMPGEGKVANKKQTNKNKQIVNKEDLRWNR